MRLAFWDAQAGTVEVWADGVDEVEALAAIEAQLGHDTEEGVNDD